MFNAEEARADESVSEHLWDRASKNSATEERFQAMTLLEPKPASVDIKIKG